MAEVCEESSHVWSSKQRTVMFLAAMRYLALALQAHGRPLHYSGFGKQCVNDRGHSSQASEVTDVVYSTV